MGNADKLKRYSSFKIFRSLAVLLFILIVMNGIGVSFISVAGIYTKRIEVNIKSMTEYDETRHIGYKSLSKASGFFKNGAVSVSTEVDSFLVKGDITLPVKTKLTDSGYMNFSGIKVTRGSYFSADALIRGSNIVLISEKLAVRLFAGLDAVGNELELFGETYKIVGLYKENSGIFAILGSDGAERVYVPFTSRKNYENLRVDTMYLKDASFENTGSRGNEVKKFLGEKLLVQPDLYNIKDYYGASAMVSQLESVFILAVGVWCVLMLASELINYLKYNFAVLRSRKKDHYFIGFIRRNILYICSIISGAAVFGISAALLIAAVKTGIYIPTEYIPLNNVFDFGFYADKVIEAINNSNASSGYFPTWLEHNFINALKINVILLFFAVPACFSFVSGVRLIKLSGSYVTESVKAISAAFILAFAAAFIFSFLAGLEFVVPLKELTIMVVFCILTVVKGRDKRKVYTFARIL
ncbi:MAG: ABC transporter permease [Clostridia bacterium]|nr:ABC transporter permease [Clostridia bacterium]